MSSLLTPINEKHLQHSKMLQEKGGSGLGEYLLFAMPILFKCDEIYRQLKTEQNEGLMSITTFALSLSPSFQSPVRKLYQSLHDLFDSYFAYFDEENPYRKDSFLMECEQDEEMCPCCHSKSMTNILEGYACFNCGYLSNDRMAGTAVVPLSFKETQNTQPVPPRFAYKKKSHLIQKLNQLLSKNYKHTNQVVIGEVVLELDKLKMDISTVTVEQIRTILKKLNRNDYYGDAYCLLRLIQKLPPVEIDTDIEEKIIYLFELCETSFAKHKGDRKNFLSYNYTIYKLLQLLEQRHLLKNIDLLKSRERLISQDQIWKRICTDLQWRFIPTI